jgi:DNA-directed RNA polymerase subunit K/omega
MTKTKKSKQLKDDTEEEYEIETETIESVYDDDDEIDIEEDVDSDIEEIEDVDESEQQECLVEKIIEDDNDYENINESDIKQEIIEKIVEPNERISPNRLTKYEMVRILGERTKQLTLGAKPMIKNYQSLSYDIIAEEELKLNMIPYKIKRPLPNGRFEIWTLDELNKDHLLSYLK